MSTPYVPLHLHTEYSLLDGAIRINDLCKFSVENGFPAVAITDHGVMYGDMELYETAIMKYSGDNGSPKLKPLLGCEFYVHNGDIKERDRMNNPCYHLVLIAKNNVGYQNIIRLTSVAWCDGFYMHPRINWELLKEHHEGLICLSACLGGEVLQNLLHKDPEKAREVAKRYKDLFGDDYYIELQDHGLEDQKRTNPELIAIAKELGIEMVITNDSHYLKKEDADMHDTLLCMNTNSDKDDPNRFHFEGNEFYVKTPEQLRESFSWLDEETFNKCIANTVKIAEGCNIKISKFDELPAYDVPANHTTESYFEYLVIEGLKKRYGGISKELKERVDYEMKVIEDMGFTAYFLITWDFIHYAKTHGIPVGPGRGSAAGSVVAYALEITDLDPIEHKLLFERFLNPERFTMPDIDIDFCIERRGEVIDYVTKKYGEDRVCQIITFGTYAAKAAVKGVARILKIPFADSNRIASLIPSEPKTHIDDALQEGMELRVMYDNDEQIVIDPIEGKTVGVKKWIDLARGIEGIKNNTGTHAAGVIIAPKPLDQILPVRPSKDGIVQTGYPPHAVTEFLSLLKMDFLGLRNLTTIYKTLTAIKKRQGIDVDINHIPLDDKPTYQMLMAGDTDGVFQLESAGMKNLVKRLRPDVFEDLGALVALFRPGPLDSGMVDKFVDRKHGRVPITFPHPALEPVLKDTYGTIVYQEQIMQVFQILADYSLGQADMVRRMMGKKKIDEMQKQKGKFIEGAARHGMAAKDATALFEDIEKFASYCFNRSHSAAYAFVAYQTAYLKCHYPVEYMSCLLSSVSNDQEKTQLYIEECNKKGIQVLPPDINKSYAEFAPDGDDIRFGLASVKQVGEVVVEMIIKEREENGEFSSIYDFCKRIDPKATNKRVLEGLIKSGAFSNLEKSRKQLMENLEYIVNTANKEAKAKELGQTNLFAGLEDNEDFAGTKFHLAGSDEEYSNKELQGFEKEFLGFYVSSHPLSSIMDKMQFLMSHKITEVKELPPDKVVTLCGLVTSARKIPYKKDPSKFLKTITMEDLTGKIEAICFHQKIGQFDSFMEPEMRIIITGKVSYREGSDEPNIIIDDVKPVDNANIFMISLKEEIPYEELVALKDGLAKHSGGDPVVIKVIEDGVETKIASSPTFWVKSSNDLAHSVKSVIDRNIDVEIKSIEEKL
ncbi:MAG: DNA polymerase III subunit alpha [Candidatus Melainabacteria bacterium]|nr:MAG: DNA polymerase III subunit alpha [Candidatus Melainabacteria bacterium]RAI13903.1 MAG: DNA polymerase III subunit alpha [Candidatus Melainabacteria bacterium]